MTDAHLVALPGTGWQVWRSALLRSTGFPADGLLRFGQPAGAAAADAHLDGTLPAAELAAAYTAAARLESRETVAIAADPLFREAITWQNTNMLAALDGLVRGGPDAPRNSTRRQREIAVVRYWQRYCGKNETTGFFGPIDWVTLDPAEPGVAVRAGAGLVRRRMVFLERWALAAFAGRLAADPEVRPWLPVSLQPHLTLDQSAGGARLRHPVQPPTRLSKSDARLLSLVDGRRPAREIAAATVADPETGFRAEADALAALDRFAERGLLHWGLDLPVGYAAERRLRDGIAAIGDPAARDRCAAGLDRLTTGRDAVAAAAGDPDALAAALAKLDEEFVAITGQAARRRPGQMYAGRTLCHEETVRDLDVVVGGPVLAALAPPLAILMQAARWLTGAVAAAYDRALRELHAELAADLGSPYVPLGQLLFLAQGPLFGATDRPADAVTADFTRRWTALFGLDRLPPATSRVQLTAAELAAAVGRTFPADRPGWSSGRIHSPDLHLCASSPEAFQRGEFSAVLGELHAAWATFDSGVFLIGHPDAESMRVALAADLGPRVGLLPPADWPRYTARLSRWLHGDTDRQLAFTPAPGADPDRLLPVTALVVSEVDGELVAHGPRPGRWPLVEVLADFVVAHAVDAFKLVEAAAHTPRITIDRLVVARETWRSTVGGTGLGAVTDPVPQFLAARRWRRAAGLPDRAFVKVATETKPCYVDFTSPLLVAALGAMLRAARGQAGDGAPVTVTELLPTPEQAWVPDAAGRRYFSELRLQLRDPHPARPAPPTTEEPA